MCKVTGVNVTVKPKTIEIHQILKILKQKQLAVIVDLLFTLSWVEKLISGRVYLNIVSVPKFFNQILVVDLNEVFVYVCNLIVNV